VLKIKLLSDEEECKIGNNEKSMENFNISKKIGRKGNNPLFSKRIMDYM